MGLGFQSCLPGRSPQILAHERTCSPASPLSPTPTQAQITITQPRMLKGNIRFATPRHKFQEETNKTSTLNFTPDRHLLPLAVCVPQTCTLGSPLCWPLFNLKGEGVMGGPEGCFREPRFLKRVAEFARPSECPRSHRFRVQTLCLRHSGTWLWLLRLIICCPVWLL